MPDTAFVFIYFQAAERITRITHDASDALISATWQETVPALGRAPEMSTVVPVVSPDTLASPTSSVRKSNSTPVQSSEVLKRKFRILQTEDTS